MREYNCPIFIYALISPIDNTVFYIGATHCIKSRLKSHKSSCRTAKSYKDFKLREIIEKGMTIEALELDVCCGEDDEIRFMEEFYIELMRSWGFYLPQLSTSQYKRYEPNDLEWKRQRFQERLLRLNLV